MTKKPVLIAFQQQTDSGRSISGKYNVWRYDTPSTICVAWGLPAASETEAVSIAMEEIK